MAETYSVVMTGKVADGMALEQVRANVGKLFKLGDEQLDKLFSGKPVAVRRNLDQQKAEKLCAALTKAGAVARIKSNRPLAAAQQPAAKKPASKPAASEPADVAPEAKAAPAPEPAAAAPTPVATAKPAANAPAELECPRCGHEQRYAKACSLCKMDLTLHLQRLERRERVRAMRKKAAG